MSDSQIDRFGEYSTRAIASLGWALVIDLSVGTGIFGHTFDTRFLNKIVGHVNRIIDAENNGNKSICKELFNELLDMTEPVSKVGLQIHDARTVNNKSANKVVDNKDRQTTNTAHDSTNHTTITTDSYTYTLSYPDNTVFYVGKGTGDRMYHHVRDYKSHPDGSLKHRVIGDILNAAG